MIDLAAIGLHTLAALLGWGLARRSPPFAPMTRALLALLALSAARTGVAWVKDGAPRPYAGAARRAWALHTATGWGWYVVVAGAVWMALRAPNDASPRVSPPEGRRKTATYVVASLAATTLAAWLAYPLVRGTPFVERSTTALAWLSAAVSIHAAFRWVTRSPRPEATPNAQAAWVLAASAAVGAAVGPYYRADPARYWYTAPWLAIFTWLLVLAVLARALVRRTPPAE